MCECIFKSIGYTRSLDSISWVDGCGINSSTPKSGTETVLDRVPISKVPIGLWNNTNSSLKMSKDTDVE